MDPTTMLERGFQANQALIAGLSPEEYTKPTPCWEWNVRALINHMIGMNHYLAASLAGQPAAAGGDTPDFVGAGAAAAYADSTRAALAAARAPGALDQTVQLGPNPLPAAALLRFAQ